jgi:6-phosphogluconolactonase
MSQVELLRFKDDRELAEAAAEQWVLELQNLASKSNRYCVALSGGRIARRFFESVVMQAKHRALVMGSIHFFWGDERCVPPTDPESNFGVARALLLAPLGILAENIHRVRGEESPERACIEAQAELCKAATINSSGHVSLDMIFLGLGEDGHVASLFPEESEELMADGRIYRPVIASKPPPRRITFGYSTIAAAKEVWVFASGPGKENALRESLASGGQTPLARGLRLRRQLRIFTDIDA